MIRARHILAAILLALASTTAAAQTPEPRDPTAKPLEQQAIEAFNANDLDESERLLLLVIDKSPDDFVPQYNLACVYALKGETDNAIAHLTRAIELGYVDLRHLKADPHLEPIRSHPTYQKIVDNWDLILSARVDANLESIKEHYGPGYLYYEDDDLKLAYAAAYTEQTFAEARDEVRRVNDWAIANVFPELAEPSEYDAWVIVLLPTRKHFQQWAIATYGAAARRNFSAIGGAYNHDRKQLVTQDLGGTLRHEFMHVLHWRSCTRLGQPHPIWIQEGLCSLVEDCDPAGNTLTPVVSFRTNTAINLARANRLLPIRELATMPRNEFAGSRPMANYAQARTFFLYLYQQGKLAEWYQTYTDTFRDDPTGIEAIEHVMGMPIEDVDAQYERWVASLPRVAEEIKPGMASLGVEVNAGEGEGPIVTRYVVRQRGDDRLRLRDVVTAIDGRPTRDLPELIRVLSSYRPGQTVEVSYRRGKLHGTANVTLVEKR